jgi:hypothetical protein
MPTEFEPSATMFLQVLLGRLHVSVKAMADATDSCIRALINHLSLKVMLPQIAQGSRDLKNTILRRRCLEYTLLMLQLHGAEAVQPFYDVFEEVLSRALGDASLECRSTARDILHLYHDYFPERAVKVVQSIDRTVRKTLELSFDLNPVLLTDSAEQSNSALNSSAGSLNATAITAAAITPDTPLSSSTPTSAISPEPLSPASSPPSSPRSVRSVRSIQSAAPTTKPRDTKPVNTPSRAPSVSGIKKPSTPATSTAKTSGVKARPASVNLSSPKGIAAVTAVTTVSRSNSVSKPKDTPSKLAAPAASTPAAKSKLSLAQVAKTTVTAKRAVTAFTAKPPAKRLELPSLKAPKSTSSLAKSSQSSTPSTAPSSPVAPSPAPVRVVEDSYEVLALKLHRLMDRTRRSIVRDQLIVPHL